VGVTGLCTQHFDNTFLSFIYGTARDSLKKTAAASALASSVSRALF